LDFIGFYWVLLGFIGFYWVLMDFYIGLAVCGKSDVINPNNNYHTLQLCGKYLDVEEVLVMGIIGFDAKMGCVLKSKVRSKDEFLSASINESIS